MTQPPDTSVAQGTNRDFAAVAGLFIGNGLAVGVLGGSLPGLRAQLDLEPGQIVGVLVAAAVVAVFSMNLSGAVSDRIGARLPALVGGVVMAMGSVVMGFAPNYVVLIVGAAVFGLGNGAQDVAMNALGVSVEQARRRPVMSRLHASFSVGNFAGALLVVALGWLVADVSPHWALWSSAVLAVVLFGAIARITPQSRRSVANADGGGGRGPIPPGIWLLARDGALLRPH